MRICRILIKITYLLMFFEVIKLRVVSALYCVITTNVT